jgi:hypothetical protein
MITENFLLFLGTLAAVFLVILIFKKFNTKGWPDPWPKDPWPTMTRWHRIHLGMLDFGVLQYSQLFLTSWIMTYLYLRYLNGDSVLIFRSSAFLALFITFLVYCYIYGMKKRDVDSVIWDTIRVGWPWYAEDDEKNQREETL